MCIYNGLCDALLLLLKGGLPNCRVQRKAFDSFLELLLGIGCGDIILYLFRGLGRRWRGCGCGCSSGGGGCASRGGLCRSLVADAVRGLGVRQYFSECSKDGDCNGWGVIGGLHIDMAQHQSGPHGFHLVVAHSKLSPVESTSDPRRRIGVRSRQNLLVVVLVLVVAVVNVLEG